MSKNPFADAIIQAAGKLAMGLTQAALEAVERRASNPPEPVHIPESEIRAPAGMPPDTSVSRHNCTSVSRHNCLCGAPRLYRRIDRSEGHAYWYWCLRCFSAGEITKQEASNREGIPL